MLIQLGVDFGGTKIEAAALAPDGRFLARVRAPNPGSYDAAIATVRDLIARVGVQPGVDQVYSYSLDSNYTCSTPFQALTDGRDAMVVVGLNGEPLADERGYPARMLVPGLFGFVSATKWLQRIEFTTYAKRTAYWTARDWATDAPILTQSRIEVPQSLKTLPKDKPVIAGVAVEPNGGVPASAATTSSVIPGPIVPLAQFPVQGKCTFTDTYGSR